MGRFARLTRRIAAARPGRVPETLAHEAALASTARRDLQSIRRYYAEHASIGVADRRVQKIVHAAERLLDHPFLGKPSERTEGVHELQIAGLPCLLPYRVVDERIEILQVFDESRPRPEGWTA